MCTDPWHLPGRGEQATLGDLIGHYESLGVPTFEKEVFESQEPFPGTELSRAACILEAGTLLRGAGIEVLQDLRRRSPGFVRKRLRPVSRDSELGRWLLMLAGTDSFVLGDASVRRFVAQATRQPSVRARDAEALLRRCAHELAVSPRLLDYLVYSETPTSS